jgi:hypothetical protein
MEEVLERLAVILDKNILSKFSDKELKELFNSLTSPKSPLEEICLPWLFAFRKHLKNYPKSTIYSGKWLIFADERKINSTWQKIRQATIEGKLGLVSKVSTRKNKEGQGYLNYVICVYTYDLRDKQDVYKIKKELRKLGIDEDICYKPDAFTHYGIKGDL